MEEMEGFIRGTIIAYGDFVGVCESYWVEWNGTKKIRMIAIMNGIFKAVIGDIENFREVSGVMTNDEKLEFKKSVLNVWNGERKRRGLPELTMEKAFEVYK